MHLHLLRDFQRETRELGLALQTGSNVLPCFPMFREDLVLNKTEVDFDTCHSKRNKGHPFARPRFDELLNSTTKSLEFAV